MTEIRPEILDVIWEIVEEMDALEIPCSIESSDQEDEINSFLITTHDPFGYINNGVIDWSEKLNRVVYVAHDPARENHDIAEGVPVEESRCWWECPDLDMFLIFLEGQVRQITRKAQKIKSKKGLDNEE